MPLCPHSCSLHYGSYWADAGYHVPILCYLAPLSLCLVRSSLPASLIFTTCSFCLSLSLMLMASGTLSLQACSYSTFFSVICCSWPPKAPFSSCGELSINKKSRTVAEHLSVTARLVISIFGFFVVYARVGHLFYIFCRSFDRLSGIFPVFLGVFLYVYSSCRQSYPTFHSSIFHSQKQASQAYFLCITLSSSLVSSKNPLVKLPESPNYHNQTHSL